MYLPHLSCLALHYFCTPLLSQFRYYLCYLYLRCHILFIASVTITFVVMLGITSVSFTCVVILGITSLIFTFVVTYYLLPLLPLLLLSY